MGGLPSQPATGQPAEQPLMLLIHPADRVANRLITVLVSSRSQIKSANGNITIAYGQVLLKTKFNNKVLFACLKFSLFGLFFQPEQCFSVSFSQSSDQRTGPNACCTYFSLYFFITSAIHNPRIISSSVLAPTA